MRIITRKRILDFSNEHPQSKAPLDAWFCIVEKSNYKSFVDLRKSFPSADNVGVLTVFNIGGNKYILIAAIHYNTKMVFIRHILTHSEYDRGKWKE